MIHILKSIKKIYTKNKYNTISYGKFFLDNPKASKKEKQKAIKKFLEWKIQK
mgnify:CR=1 FL=1